MMGVIGWLLRLFAAWPDGEVDDPAMPDPEIIPTTGIRALVGSVTVP